MSNSIGPCPTELDTMDSNIGAGSRWFGRYEVLEGLKTLLNPFKPSYSQLTAHIEGIVRV